MNDESGEHENDGHGNAAGMIGLAALVALVAVSMLWSIASRKSTDQAAAGLNKMFAEVVVRLANGDAISRGQDDQQLQIPAGMTRTVDVVVPYEEQEPASCAVTLSVGAGGTVATRGSS